MKTRQQEASIRWKGPGAARQQSGPSTRTPKVTSTLHGLAFHGKGKPPRTGSCQCGYTDNSIEKRQAVSSVSSREQTGGACAPSMQENGHSASLTILNLSLDSVDEQHALGPLRRLGQRVFGLFGANRNSQCGFNGVDWRKERRFGCGTPGGSARCVLSVSSTGRVVVH
jgi:hypothetical protein